MTFEFTGKINTCIFESKIIICHVYLTLMNGQFFCILSQIALFEGRLNYPLELALILHTRKNSVI